MENLLLVHNQDIPIQRHFHGQNEATITSLAEVRQKIPEGYEFENREITKLVSFLVFPDHQVPDAKIKINHFSFLNASWIKKMSFEQYMGKSKLVVLVNFEYEKLDVIVWLFRSVTSRKQKHQY